MAIEYVTPKQLAEKFQAHPSTVYRLHKEGKIPSIRFGSKLLFVLSEVEAALKAVNHSQKPQHA